MTSVADTGFLGHPLGLVTLFFTEMWERFSYYGMRAFLILYMTAPAATGGLALPDADAASLYGTYTASAWGASIVGGFVADRFLGQYRSVLLGGTAIMLGHFTLVFTALPFFYTGLALIVVGTGLLKPNVSTLVGALYAPEDRRRDAGFSIFYMGINLGALLGPLVAGYLAQRVSWHVGFGCAGVGMLLGLGWYVLGRSWLQPALERIVAPATAPPAVAPANGREGDPLRFTRREWQRIGIIVILFAGATLFWAGYEQAGSTLTLFADRYTRLTMFGFDFPSSWFQSVQPFFVIFVLGPFFAWLWIKLGPREPSVLAKFAFGLFFMALAFLVLVPAGALAQSGGVSRVSPMWLVGAYFLSEVGELALSPVGLSAVTKLAPTRIAGLMMGLWFLGSAFGNKLAGSAAGFMNSLPLDSLFGIMAGVLLAGAVAMLIVLRVVRGVVSEAR